MLNIIESIKKNNSLKIILACVILGTFLTLFIGKAINKEKKENKNLFEVRYRCENGFVEELEIGRNRNFWVQELDRSEKPHKKVTCKVNEDILSKK